MGLKGVKLKKGTKWNHHLFVLSLDIYYIACLRKNIVHNMTCINPPEMFNFQFTSDSLCGHTCMIASFH